MLLQQSDGERVCMRTAHSGVHAGAYTNTAHCGPTCDTATAMLLLLWAKQMLACAEPSTWCVTCQRHGASNQAIHSLQPATHVVLGRHHSQQQRAHNDAAQGSLHDTLKHRAAASLPDKQQRPGLPCSVRARACVPPQVRCSSTTTARDHQRRPSCSLLLITPKEA